MENEKLFGITERGYNCKQVDEYLNVLKAEYKKLYDYAKSTEDARKIAEQKITDLASENEKLQEASIAWEAEKEMLRRKAENAHGQAPVTESQTVKGTSCGTGEYDVLVKSLSTMNLLSEEIVRENRALREKLEQYEAR